MSKSADPLGLKRRVGFEPPIIPHLGPKTLPTGGDPLRDGTGSPNASARRFLGGRCPAKFRWQRAIMPYAMGFQRNTQKPKENHHISWFCAARGHASESFFREFSLLGALWATSGIILATLGRYVSAFGWLLGAQRLNQGPLPGCDRAGAD